MTETARTEPGTPPDLSSDFGHALGNLFSAYFELAREAVADLPGGPRAYQVMSLATVNSCRNQAGIAESLGLDRTVMTYLVDGLETAGLVERRPDPMDRRGRQVVVTERGREAHAAAAIRLQQVEREVLGGLTEAQSDTFRQLLRRASQGVSAPDWRSACDA